MLDAILLLQLFMVGKLKLGKRLILMMRTLPKVNYGIP